MDDHRADSDRPGGAAIVRAAIVAAGARLAARGLIAATEGNLSVRLDEGQVLVTPSGRRKDELEPSDLLIVTVDAGAEGRDAEIAGAAASAPRPTSDLAIHRAIYAARPDVAAIVHAHSRAAMALTLGGGAPDPARLPETALFLPRLPFVGFGQPGSEELAARIAAAFAEGPEPRAGAVVLQRHGAIAVGGAGGDPVSALALAVDRMELVDVLCRVQLDALLFRAARRATPEA